MPHTSPDQFALEVLDRLTQISSPSHDLEGIIRAFRYLELVFSSSGLDASIDTTDLGTPTLPVLVAGNRQTSRPLLVIGHIDTVLPASPPRRQDDRFYATGAIDMKGGLAAFAGALSALANPDHPARVPEDLLVVIVPDEEVGGISTESVMAKIGSAARALWVLEPGASLDSGYDPAGSEPGSRGETLVIGRRGLISFSVTIRGTAAHSGNDFTKGRSALLAAADWSLEASNLVTATTSVNIGRVVAGTSNFVEDLQSSASLIGTGAQINVVPDAAVLEGEARVLTASEFDPLIHRLSNLSDAIATRREVEVDFEVTASIAALEPTQQRRAYAQQACRLAANRGWRLDLEDQRGGISFPNFLPAGHDIPVLDGLGPVGDGMHSTREFVYLSSLTRRVSLLTDLLSAECDLARD